MALYVVRVSTENGPVTGVVVDLAAAPSTQKALFTVGCAKGDGAASCSVGALSAGASTELQAKIAVATTATSVTAVKLTATGHATNLIKLPSTSETVTVTTASAPSSAAGTTGAGPTVGAISTLPLGQLPTLAGAGSSLIPGVTAGGLFPTVNPSSAPDPTSGAQAKAAASSTPVANTSTLPIGTPQASAQIVGLAVLALGVALAVTRLSVRKRPAPGGKDDAS
jgi:hypothetical protein